MSRGVLCTQLLVAALATVFASAQKADAALMPSFTVPGKEALQRGQLVHDELRTKASEEGVVSFLLRTDCYSQALQTIRKECKTMSEDERSRLAVAMANCFLAKSAQKSYRCSPSMSIKACTQDMDDRAFSVFTQFFTNMHAVCVFLQNQDFQRQTEHIVNQLFSSTHLALMHLTDIRGNLTQQQQALAAMGGSLTHLAASQQEVAGQVSQGLAELARLQQQARGLEGMLGASLALEEEIRSRQAHVAEGLAQLDEAERQRALAAQAHWQSLERHAEGLQARQELYEQLQQQLVASSQSLLASSSNVQCTLDVIMRYEQRSDAVLTYLLGRSYSLQDISFYAAGLLLLLLLGSVPSLAPLRPLLLLLLLSSLAAERAAAHLLQPWLTVTPNGKVVLDVAGSMLGLLLPHGLELKWLPRVAGLLASACLLLARLLSQQRLDRQVALVLREMDQKLEDLNRSCNVIMQSQKQLSAAMLQPQATAMQPATAAVPDTPTSLLTSTGAGTAVGGTGGQPALVQLPQKRLVGQETLPLSVVAGDLNAAEIMASSSSVWQAWLQQQQAGAQLLPLPHMPAAQPQQVSQFVPLPPMPTAHQSPLPLVPLPPIQQQVLPGMASQVWQTHQLTQDVAGASSAGMDFDHAAGVEGQQDMPATFVRGQVGTGVVAAAVGPATPVGVSQVPAAAESVAAGPARKGAGKRKRGAPGNLSHEGQELRAQNEVPHFNRRRRVDSGPSS